MGSIIETATNVKICVHSTVCNMYCKQMYNVVFSRQSHVHSTVCNVYCKQMYNVVFSRQSHVHCTAYII